ncbi:hypothetical protein ACJJTC_007166 [Scirpophaga incertulas]
MVTIYVPLTPEELQQERILTQGTHATAPPPQPQSSASNDLQEGRASLEERARVGYEQGTNSVTSDDLNPSMALTASAACAPVAPGRSGGPSLADAAPTPMPTETPTTTQKQLPSTSGGTPLGTNTETPGPNTTGEQHLTTSALLASTTHTEQTISISLLPENPATPPSARRPQRRTTPQSSSSPSCSSSLWERSPQTWTHSVRKSNK